MKTCISWIVFSIFLGLCAAELVANFQKTVASEKTGLLTVSLERNR